MRHWSRDGRNSVDGGGDGERNEKSRMANLRSRGESLPHSSFGPSGRGRSQEPRRRSSSVVGPILNGQYDQSNDNRMHSPLLSVLVPVENSVGDKVELSFVAHEHVSFHNDDNDLASRVREQNPINGRVEGVGSSLGILVN